MEMSPTEISRALPGVDNEVSGQSFRPDEPDATLRHGRAKEDEMLKSQYRFENELELQRETTGKGRVGKRYISKAI